MFDFGLGSSELLLVAMIALIVIGPKDLPRLLRTMGQYMRKIQGMAREFQNHLNEAAKESGVDDVKKEVKGMTNFTVTSDLDKQGAEIKKAIESGAPKPANGGKAEAKTESAKVEAGKSPQKSLQKPAPGKPETDKAATDKAGTRPKSEPQPKGSKPAAEGPGKAAPKKAAPKPAPKSAAARKSPAKPQSKPKAARAAEAAKS